MDKRNGVECGGRKNILGAQQSYHNHKSTVISQVVSFEKFRCDKSHHNRKSAVISQVVPFAKLRCDKSNRNRKSEEKLIHPYAFISKLPTR